MADFNPQFPWPPFFPDLSFPPKEGHFTSYIKECSSKHTNPFARTWLKTLLNIPDTFLCDLYSLCS